jgi:hypothetical protein
VGFEFDLCLVFHKEQTCNTALLKLNLIPPSDEFLKVFTHSGPLQRDNISRLFHMCMERDPRRYGSS